MYVTFVEVDKEMLGVCETLGVCAIVTGIMTHHVGYTLQFEQALQLVDPSVTVPYWEYTLEGKDKASAFSGTVQASQ